MLAHNRPCVAVQTAIAYLAHSTGTGFEASYLALVDAIFLRRLHVAAAERYFVWIASYSPFNLVRPGHRRQETQVARSLRNQVRDQRAGGDLASEGLYADGSGRIQSQHFRRTIR